MAEDVAKARVLLDGQQAQNELEDLEKKAKAVNAELKRMRVENDPNLKAKQKEYAQLSKEIDKARKETFDYNAVLKNLSGATLKDLQRAEKSLNVQLRTQRRDTQESRMEFSKKAQDLKRVRGEIANVRGEMSSLKKVQSQQGFFGPIRAGWLAISAGIFTVWRGIQSVIEARDEELRRTAELKGALQGNEEITQRLIRYASQLQRNTGVADESIKGWMTFLALQGRSEEQIKNTVLAAMELSKVTGQGMNEVLKQLDRTFEGTLGELGNFDSGLKDLTKTQLANGAAIDLLLEKYGGASERAFKAGMSGLRSFQLAIGDFQKTLGMGLVNGLSPFFQGVADIINKLDSSLRLASQSSKQLFDDQLDSVVNLNTGIVPLLDRYDQLKTKTNLSTAEQQELRDIIQNVSDTIPSAISGFDEYGQAISISTDRAKQFVNTEVSRLQVMNAKAIEETQKAIRTRERLISNSLHNIKEIEEKGFFEIIENVYSPGLQTTIQQTRRATQEEISETINKHQTLLNEVQGYKAELQRLNGDYLMEAQKEREKQLNAEREAEEQRVEYMRKSLAELRQLSSEGDEMAKKVLESKNDEAKAVETVSNAYDQLIKKHADLQKELRHMVATGDLALAHETKIIIDQLEKEITRLNTIIKTLDKPAPEETTPASMDPMGTNTDFLESNHERALEREREILAEKMQTHNKDQEATRRIQAIKKEVHQQAMQMLSETAVETIGSAIHMVTLFQNVDYDKKLKDLDKWRSNELKNKDLSEAAKAKIEEEYQKKTAALKKDSWKKQRNADLLSSVISGALAVTRALAAFPGWPLNAPFVVAAGVQAGLQSSMIATQPIPQFYTGRYPVKGATDGRLYHPELLGEAKTGLYKKPALIAERGTELIIDAPTTRNLQINHPEIIAGIMRNRVPQYFDGRYPDSVSTATSVSANNDQIEKTLNRLADTIQGMGEINNYLLKTTQKLDAQLNQGIQANVSLFQLEKLQNKRDSAESETSY